MSEPVRPADKREHTLIQSYVDRRWFVSTAFRRASGVQEVEVWYYETLIWEWDPETKELGKMHQAASAWNGRHAALKGHAGICIRLAKEASGE